MDGLTLAKICDAECLKRGLSKTEFYKKIGLSAASFHGWKNGATPSQKYIDAIEQLFNIDLSEYENAQGGMDEETASILQMIRENYGYRAVCRSAIDLTPAQAFEAAAFIEKLKERST